MSVSFQKVVFCYSALETRYDYRESTQETKNEDAGSFSPQVCSFSFVVSMEFVVSVECLGFLCCLYALHWDWK